MERLFFILLIGFAIVLLVHSWLLMNLSQKYNLFEEKRLKNKNSVHSEMIRKQNSNRKNPNQQKNKGRISR